MNLNGDEERIRQLFRELSRDDERRAPEFASVIDAAGSRTAGSQNGTRSFALKWAVAVIFVAMLIAASFAVRHPKPKTPIDQSDQVAASPGPEKTPAANIPPEPPLDAPGKTARRAIPRRVPRRRTSDELAILMKSLSAWQSPTASLLKAPGEEILKSLPRLGESFQSITFFSPDQFN